LAKKEEGTTTFKFIIKKGKKSPEGHSPNPAYKIRGEAKRWVSQNWMKRKRFFNYYERGKGSSTLFSTAKEEKPIWTKDRWQGAFLGSSLGNMRR